MIFWLDTADSKATTPYFYISKGIEVAEGEEKPAERMFMYNATDSMSIFDENSAQASFNEKYMLEGTTKEDKIAKVIFRPATIAGVDTINTVVEGKAAVVAAKENKAEEVLAGLVTSSSVSAWLTMLWMASMLSTQRQITSMYTLRTVS